MPDLHCSLLHHLIAHAQKSIHLQVYIYEGDETGQRLADALIAAAKRNVDIYMLLDGYGSQNLTKSFVQQFKDNGIHIRFFEPLFKSGHFYIGRRMHQKVAVVDAHYAMVTGINIGSRYNGEQGVAWLDFAVFVEGKAAERLYEWCWMTWNNFQKIKNLPPSGPHSSVIDMDYDDICEVRIRRNDWVRNKHEITRTYKEILQTAKSRVVILSSYFLPGYAVRRDIKAARRRGVEVKLIVCSRMDVPLVKDAERFMYRWLLRHGVEIYEYSGNMLHGKLAICDSDWMTIGSFNVNDVSARVSVELNLDVRSAPFVQRTSDVLEDIMENDCTRVYSKSFKRRNGALNQLVQWFAFRFLRIIFFLCTFYMKQEKKKRE